MNHKSINDLDPKLREAYEKVMGTTFSPASAPIDPQSQSQQTQPVQAPQQPLMQTAPAPEPTPAVQYIPIQPAAPTNPMLPPLPSQNPFVQTPEPPPTVLAQAGNFPTGMTQPAKKRGIMPILFVIGGLIFFVAYAFIWAKVFGLA